MAKEKIRFECSNCGHISPKWLGVCPVCGEWNTFLEKRELKKKGKKHKVDISEEGKAESVRLSDISTEKQDRMPTGMAEFDRVLGGGFVPGSFLLLGGDPGIGKSTLMLQTALECPDMEILYIAGEESGAQIRQRALRLGLKGENLFVSSDTDVHSVIGEARNRRPDLLIIDSIQTLYSDELTSLPGSVQQIRECSAMLQQIAKKEGVTTLMIGHVTKEGDIAGPRILEHTVDTVLHFEGDKNQLYRLLRCVKNRFGPAQEVGVFEMKESGLKQVSNPSALFLSERQLEVSGNCVACIMEGTRPILIEVQALVTPSSYGSPQRTSSGFDQRRLTLLIAVLEKRLGMQFSGQDVYLNIAGGLKITDPAADLAVVSALASSLKDRILDQKRVFVGEVGLGGEVRNVSYLQQRLKEAEKMGIEEAIIPRTTLTPGKLSLKMVDSISGLS